MIILTIIQSHLFSILELDALCDDSNLSSSVDKNHVAVENRDYDDDVVDLGNANGDVGDDHDNNVDDDDPTC